VKPRLFVLLAPIALLLGACASPQIARNDKVKPATYSSVVVIAPMEDKRNVIPQVADKFRELGLAVTVAAGNKPLSGSLGTAFFLTPDGYLLSCAHVVGKEELISIWVGGVERRAKVVAKDDEKDMALLKADFSGVGSKPVPVSFRMPLSPRLGEPVSTLGFPMSPVLGTHVRHTSGQISALFGIKDDPSQLQFSAQIQSGSSGSPLYDANGAVVGMVSRTLSTAEAGQATGAVPQNVNFAVRADTVLAFVREKAPALYERLSFNGTATTDQLQGSVTRVRAGTGPLDEPRKGQLIALVAYSSIWDMWYRFRFFAIKLIDAPTGDPILVAGQDHDTVISNEAKVIDATFEEIRKALAATP
jgi:S1-C subfamily serine protease